MVGDKSNPKRKENDPNAKSNLGVSSANLITLINPNERLVKKETKSVVVRNSAGKLVRRTFQGDVLPSVYETIREGEVFVREEEMRIVVRNEDGKLVARRKPIEIEEEIIEEDSLAPEKPTAEQPKEVVQEVQEENKQVKEAPKEEKGDLKSRLLSKHAFLGRMERGEKIGVMPTMESSKTMEVVNSDLVEEIEDEEEIEEIAPDADVTELENAVTQEKYNRDMGKGSSKGLRAGDTGTHISSGAINPNEKPALKGTNTGNGLVGNYVLATPEKETELEEPKQKKKRVKKQRKPVKPWVIAVSFVALYVLGMAVYFFTGYNFDKKQVNVVLYYIDVGTNAKLEYYDGEKFNFNDMKMTYYYSDENIESFNISERHFAETTVGMGYGLNKGYINALWIDSFSGLGQRTVKVKFTFDNLICYVPVTIYRNRLDSVFKTFELEGLSAGQEIVPTLFGVYTNKVLEERNENITRELSFSEYDLILHYGGESYKLKDLGLFNGTKFVMPTTINDVPVDYTDPSVSLTATVSGDGYSSPRSVTIY